MSSVKHTLYDGVVVVDFNEERHTYTIAVDGKKPRWRPSVTGITGMLDNGKTGRLQGWAVKMGYLAAEQLLRLHLGGKVTPDLIANVVEAVKGAHRKKLSHAGALGSAVHAWIEKYIRAQMSGKKEPALPEVPSLEERKAYHEKRIAKIRAGKDVGMLYGAVSTNTGAAEGETDEQLIERLAKADVADAQAIRNGVDSFLKWRNAHQIKWLLSEQVVYSVEHDYVGTLDILAEVDGVTTLVDIKTSNYLVEEHWLQTSAYVQALSEEYEFDKPLARTIIKVAKDDARVDVFTDAAAKRDLAEDVATFVALRAVYRCTKERESKLKRAA